MEQFVTFINDLLWGNVLIYCLLGAGIFFTIRLNFIQIRHFLHMFTVLRHSRTSSKSGISSFQALCTSLAARVGTGNIAGVAVAITLGGPGAVFWMWIIAFIGMSTTFAECTLAQLYKTKDDDGCFRGGPAYYMEYGLGKRWMGIIFSILLIICFGLAFNAVQSNAISSAVEAAFSIPKIYTGIALVIACALIIFGGIRSVAKFAEIAVPFMALFYLGIALIIVIMNITEIPRVIALIFESAFGFHEVMAGGISFTIRQAMINGIRRGLFSNEAGMGSAPNVAASAEPYPHHPASQGYVQMLGVFVDTLVICSATAAIILSSGVLETVQSAQGVELTQAAMSMHLGTLGHPLVAIAILLFAFTTILANYSYAETNFVFLGRHSNKIMLNSFRCCMLFMVLFGSVGTLPLVWSLADISMGLMTLINLLAIILLSKTAIKLAKDYNKQRKENGKPNFKKENFEGYKGAIQPGCWD